MHRKSMEAAHSLSSDILQEREEEEERAREENIEVRAPHTQLVPVVHHKPYIVNMITFYTNESNGLTVIKNRFLVQVNPM